MIAVLLLSYAFVQSTVMQAAAASPAPAALVCGMDHMAGMAMAAMAAPDRDAGKAPAHPSGHTACPFCVAASQPPVTTAPILAPFPVTVVFVAFLALVSHGPRGPPAHEPRARGPPLSPATA